MEQVFRCYVEKRSGFDVEAMGVMRELREQLGIAALTGVRILNRYDVDGLDQAAWQAARDTVFSEPQCDTFYEEDMPAPGGVCTILAVEALPGQYDQRADSAQQCIQLLTGGERPRVACAKVYVLMGELTEGDLKRIKGYLINPVECREASMDKPATLAQDYPMPPAVRTIDGFTAMDETALNAMLGEYGLAMDLNDLKFMQAYFRDEEKRDPTVTELRVVDTYWSDHCRHTTFGTHIDSAEILDSEVAQAYQEYLAAREEVYGPEKAAVRPQTLMDMATLGAKVLKKRGVLTGLDESEEINACSVHVTATVDGEEQDWLLMFKNETHNHPTEIEPFGGAATCIGGAIRDPLSGRAYVYQAMRVTGCGDPRTPLDQTLSGKLPQRKIAQTAAAGYSSYGNQIGLATGLVSELYHPGYVAKHLEVGAVVGAAPADNVVRERPAPGDVVILLGGRTGRDGIGGATGSSKSHNLESLDTMASEVQKGNAPEERKIQRLFRRGEVTRLIKRCNDFGAGGVSVAIGELADGLAIRPGRGAQEVRRPGRHRAGHLREPGAHGRGGGPRGRRRLHRRRREREPGGLSGGHGHRGPPHGHDLERPDRGQPVPGLPVLQRRGQAHHRRRPRPQSPREGAASLPPAPAGRRAGSGHPAGPGGAVRRLHRRGQRAHALRRRGPDQPRPGHGRPAARGPRPRDRHLLRHGLGL